MLSFVFGLLSSIIGSVLGLFSSVFPWF